MSDRRDLLCGVSEHERLADELAQTRAVLDDVLHERGQSWLAEVARQRNAIFGYLTGLEDKYGRIWRCSSCDAKRVGELHSAACVHALLCRIIGGPEETQRQVDAAHEEAMAERGLFDIPPVQNGLWRAPQIRVDPNTGEGQVLVFSEETWPPPRNRVLVSTCIQPEEDQE